MIIDALFGHLPKADFKNRPFFIHGSRNRGVVECLCGAGSTWILQSPYMNPISEISPTISKNCNAGTFFYSTVFL